MSKRIWTIEFASEASRELDALEAQVARRVLKFLNERLATIENPRAIGEALKGSKLGDLWKYRVGDYRIIADIEDQLIRILVVRIGNRKEVYR
jgi:mRNA interferase RelE/StbE